MRQGTEMKLCLRCKENKRLTEFCPDKGKRFGKSSVCRKCHNEISSRYYYNNKEKALSATRKWQGENAEKCLENKRIWKKENSEKVKDQYQRWWAKDPEKALAMFRGYSQKQRNTIKGNITNRIVPAMARALRGNKQGRAWESLVGYTVDDLRKHLENNFLPGMSWENRNLWHIDHKIPKSVFNYETTDDIDFKKCWTLSNLQPMWALKNISKKDKINNPFQPSLLIAVGG